MLFQSLVPGIFTKIESDLTSAGHSARKREARKRLDYFHGEQVEYLEEILSQLFTETDQIRPVILNIVKKVVRSSAMTYAENPTRQIVNGTEKDTQIFKQIVEGSNLNAKLKQASRYLKLLNNLLIRVVWRNNKIDFDLITSDIFDVGLGTTPEEIRTVIVTDYGNASKPQEVEYSLWTTRTWQRLDWQGNVLEQKQNPYEVLPFVPCFDHPPTDNFWLTGGEDLINLQDAINLRITDLNYLINCQSFGVGYIRGTPGGASLRVDPGSMIELPIDGSIGFESQKAEIGAVVDAISKILAWACISQGLSAASMSTSPTEASGLSKLVDRAELNEIRRDDVENWRSIETRLFDLVRTVNNVHSREKIGDKAALEIDFADPEQTTQNAYQRSQADQMQIADGIISPVDVLLRQNPDFGGDREKALAHLIKIKEENRALTE